MTLAHGMAVELVNDRQCNDGVFDFVLHADVNIPAARNRRKEANVLREPMCPFDQLLGVHVLEMAAPREERRDAISNQKEKSKRLINAAM